MKILVSGSSGLVGSELVSTLKKRGHQVYRLVRKASLSREDTLLWDPEHVEIRLGDFEGFDAVIHLAGENIAAGRWNAAKKKKIRDSRVLGTHMLSELLSRLENPPKLLIAASAIGYYGSRGDELLDETAPPGTGFLADVCQKWEAAVQPAIDRGIRVVQLRIGVVLSAKGGALKQMLVPFKLGLGGPIGNGNQYMSWIAMDDLIGVILFVLSHQTIQGPLNTASPNPSTNREFTQALAKVLHRPAFLPFPAFAAKLVFGEMADELLLSSTRVVPDKLSKAGYVFLFPDLPKALKHLLA